MLDHSKLYFGGDYNPEQWPKEVWAEDIALMQKANVNLVSLGIFSWAKIEQSEGVYTFDWLDEIMDLLDQGGIAVDMATATASPPAWLTLKYPSVLPINFDGVQLSHGGRQQYCAASSIYREKAAALVEQIAKRYAKHPAIKMWHVNNEYGCHAPYCYCDESRKSFVNWLKNHYASIEELNTSWGTDFWSQRYYSWEEIVVPKRTPDGTHPNPGQQIDFKRFSNDVTLELFKMERDIIKKYDPIKPVTTNFMSMKFTYAMDYFAWAKEVDFVSTDHYLAQHDIENHIDLAQMADLTRAFAKGKQWLLMEHSSSAVNWQPKNYAKIPGQEIRNSLSFVSRGSQGSMYFQWRQSQAGSERMHSSMLPHAGEDTRVFREVAELGAILAAHPEISSYETDKAAVAMVFDYEQIWAMMQANMPTDDLSYPDTVASWYRALYKEGIKVDFVPANADLETLKGYQLVLMPMAHMLTESEEKTFTDYATGGGNLVVGYFSNITDRTLRVKLGGYGGNLVKDVIGVYVEEYYPLREASIKLSNGFTAKLWSELSRLNGAEAIATFEGGDAKGSVALAKRDLGSSTAWYQGTELEDDSQRKFFSGICKELGIESVGGEHLEITKRGPFTFEIDNAKNTFKVTRD
ncbi:beta-galactosidase [Candidatus Aquiluna sp. UB-MaderosW2red]|uniref:beta-galactosidase n=1 Tax=Candidatus Aquiluna sp. UB-MaderosW2red TaxID=1855377 RepID=UPI000875AC77|nr:beta-galactosidase [Candidatus Aquiluna sp. UB-MaderosW2red]SCX09153.1 beta-galactosidase [Candidatus Aquiluna sp. UB-MaderosW2red]